MMRVIAMHAKLMFHSWWLTRVMSIVETEIQRTNSLSLIGPIEKYPANRWTTSYIIINCMAMAPSDCNWRRVERTNTHRKKKNNFIKVRCAVGKVSCCFPNFVTISVTRACVRFPCTKLCAQHWRMYTPPTVGWAFGPLILDCFTRNGKHMRWVWKECNYTVNWTISSIVVQNGCLGWLKQNKSERD